MKKNTKKTDQLVTKSYVDKHIAVLIKHLDARFAPLEAMAKDYYEFKDQVLKTLDWLVGAFKKFDEEHTVLTDSHSNIQQKVDTHEKRITLLETKIAV